MRKLYFIASIPATAKDGVITGVVANGTGRNATAEEVTALVELLRTKGATPSLLDSLRDATYPGPVSAFDRRAAARVEADILNSFNGGGLFNWHIIELGDSIRKPVRKPLGWRIMVDGNCPSSYNHPNIAAGERVKVDHAEQFGGDTDANYLFPTREAARKVMKDEELPSSCYSLVPVYADA
ncbi:hypothetical protein CPT_Pagan_011 [Xanthomonas phage Pagan]|uniref:Uncharacterized protein n=1 Tax=Xanthomonas phage Pagan TaxID=2591104 RepID=A0A5B9N6G3_9CAUD|nr:hypothetical protein CPT_Pagan_011 [Xanthomonas phage Pagan]